MATQAKFVERNEDRNQETGAARRRSISYTPNNSQPISGSQLRWLSLFLLYAMTCIGFAASAKAQTFQAIKPIVFTKSLNSTSNPLPQVLTVASTGTNFNFYAKTVDGTGGSWLTQSTNTSYSQATPFGVSLYVNPDTTLAAGTYTAQLSLTPSGSSTATIVPVSLIIEPTSATYLDELPGGLTFSSIAKGAAPPAQTVSVRNAGSGTLKWTATESTADGGSWLKLSASSGTAPSTLSVSINPAALPDTGQIAGTYTGQVALKTGSDTVTIPISVFLGDTGSKPVFQQLGPLYFTKTVNSTSEPLAQIINVSSAGNDFNFYASAINGTGGSWLSQSTNASYSQSTSNPVNIGANPATNLPAGVYTSQILLTASGGHEVQVIPATLTVESTNASYFDELPGALTFSLVINGTAPPKQLLQIRNAGEGTLKWSATALTADGGSWITLSSTSGTAPSTPSIGIDPSRLPNSGQLVGTFTGQILLTSGLNSVTVPITVTVGDTGSNPAFRQINPIAFTKTVNSTSQPLSQIINIASTGNSFNFYAYVVNGTGGNWLSQSTNSSYSQSTPHSITLAANPATNLAAGTYTAQVVVYNAGQSMVIPVTLTVESGSATYFDELPGELTFSMVASGAAPPSQIVQINNAGSGTLNFTVSTSTSDGGKWLTASTSAGTAPYLLSISVTPSALPNTGQVVGTFTGQILLTRGTDSVTIPVSIYVGDTGSYPVFRQLNPLSFVKTLNSVSQPLYQIITVASTGNSFNFYASVINGTGGNWLSQSTNSSYSQATPHTVTIAANPAVDLAAGVYTAEVLITSSGGAESMVVPVSITVEPTTTAFFDELPGALTFSGEPTGAAIAGQPVPIRNAGPGTLNWQATARTADSGGWITLSAASGTAPSTPIVTINPAKLPNAGKVAGTFVGQVLLQSASGMVTIPVTVTIGDSVFHQPAALNLTMSHGGSAPATQTLDITSTGNNFKFYAYADNGTGGNWLSQSTNSSYSQSTPYTLTVSANPASDLASGVYTGQIYVVSSGGAEPSIIPVTLTVTSSTPTATPKFTPPGGSYSTTQNVTIASSTIDAAIYFTTDGSTPTPSSTRYSAPIQVSATETIKAIAIAPGFPQSAVATAVYTFTTPKAATPGATITISEATSGVTVYYTTNGSTPTTSSAKYTGPITVSSSEVLKFIAIGPNYSASQVRTVSTTIQ